MINDFKITALKRGLEPKFQFFVTFDVESFKFNKLYLALSPMYCSEIFTHDVNNIEVLFNNIILSTFNIIKLL